MSSSGTRNFALSNRGRCRSDFARSIINFEERGTQGGRGWRKREREKRGGRRKGKGKEAGRGKEEKKGDKVKEKEQEEEGYWRVRVRKQR